MNSDIRSLIETRFGGVLRGGSHPPDGEACALEAASVVRGVEWTDEPELVGLPDLRPINDGPWSSHRARTEALVPVLDALWDWSDWSEDRRQAWAKTVALRTVREVLPIALRACGLGAKAARCEGAETLDAATAAAAAAAWTAAKAATAAAAAWAAWAAARAAARAAGRAAWAAAEASAAVEASDEILQLACRIWIEAAQESAA